MKIGYSNIDLPEGKVKYQDEKLATLVEKHHPKKVSPYYVELVKEDFNKTEGIVIPRDDLLDLLIQDTIKCETRLHNSDDSAEKSLMEKCLRLMEDETPLCDADFTKGEQEQLLKLGPLSYKPVVVAKEDEDLNDIIRRTIDKAGLMFFYTAGPREVHAWATPKGSDIITCAGKIHSDLARGFIKGDVVDYDDYTKCHNFNDCKKKGVAKVVDRDYIVENDNIIEIRFNI